MYGILYTVYGILFYGRDVESTVPETETESEGEGMLTFVHLSDKTISIS